MHERCLVGCLGCAPVDVEYGSGMWIWSVGVDVSLLTINVVLENEH